MPYFSRRLQAGTACLNFYFNRIFTAEGIRWHVSVKDNDGKTHIFHLKEAAEGWLFVDREIYPSWINAMEKTFEEEIVKHLTTEDV